jgi:hypothetical protein
MGNWCRVRGASANRPARSRRVVDQAGDGHAGTGEDGDATYDPSIAADVGLERDHAHLPTERSPDDCRTT